MDMADHDIGKRRIASNAAAPFAHQSNLKPLKIKSFSHLQSDK